MMDENTIAEAIARQRSGYPLERCFYNDPSIYERDMERILLRSWIYAGHVSEIPNPGDYFLTNYADESVIIVRDDSGEINALLNVCRHRGSRICSDDRGCNSRLVCRYHGWTYGLDGELMGAAHMPDSFDKSGLALKKAQSRTLHGLIFINLSAEPVAFDHIDEDLADCLRPYDLENAKVAHRKSYPIAANWKLALENYNECYHCAPAHPEYSRGHGRAVPPAECAGALEVVMARADSCGLSSKMVNKSYLDATHFGADSYYDRYPLVRGHLTGSRDGKPVAPAVVGGPD